MTTIKPKNVIERIDELSKGDPKRIKILNDLYDDLKQYFEENPDVVYTDREQKAFIAGMMFYIEFDNKREKHNQNLIEQEISKLENEIAIFKGEKQ